MSLRDFPPNQDISKKLKWRHLRYVPLVMLAVLSVVAAGVGFAVTRTQSDSPAPVVPEQSDSGSRLPEVCHPAAQVATQETWTGVGAAASEQTLTEHADELTNAYVVGEDGFVDWGDIQASNFSQAIGRRYLTPEELERWHSYLADLDATLGEAGIPLYIVIAPMKWAVYPEGLPEWAQGIRGPGPLDQLMAVGGDLPLVDLRAPLQESEFPTYSRVNSHWSDYGAYVGWNALVDCMNASDSGIAGLASVPATGVTLSDEHNEFADYGITSPEADWAMPEFAQPLLPVELTSAGEAPETVDGSSRTDMLRLPATTLTTGAQSDQSVLFVRDSFGGSMSVYLQQSFAHSLQVRHNFDGDPGTQPDIPTLAATYRPDVVILEIAQRHLTFPPLP